MGTVRIKEPSKTMIDMATPSENNGGRRSIGMENSVGEYFYISLDSLIPFKHQGRKSFNQDELEKLALSIEKYGVRQPLSIVKSEEFSDKFEIVSGERRFRAAKIARLDKIPCIIMGNYKEAESVAIIENIHRADLHPVELAHAYKSLLDNGQFSSGAELIESLGINKSSFYETMKILNLDPDIQQEMLNNNISSREKIRTLLKSNDPMLSLLKMVSPAEKSGYCRSILRVGINQGEFSVQKEAISKLKKQDKEKLKEVLVAILGEI